MMFAAVLKLKEFFTKFAIEGPCYQYLLIEYKFSLNLNTVKPKHVQYLTNTLNSLNG
jgi:hypothetical protein